MNDYAIDRNRWANERGFKSVILHTMTTNSSHSILSFLSSSFLDLMKTLIGRHRINELTFYAQGITRPRKGGGFEGESS